MSDDLKWNKNTKILVKKALSQMELLKKSFVIYFIKKRPSTKI